MNFKPEEKQTFCPLVSVIIPVYNGSNYLAEAIDSALAQTYKNTEIIVVNDGSCDEGETERVAKSYGEKIRFISKENGGVSTALNEGIRSMRGEYFSWLSHDDVYNPEKIEKEILALSELEDKTAIVKCETEFIDGNSMPITLHKKRRNGKYFELKSSNKALTELLRSGTFNGCALLIHKKVFEICGLFDERLRFNQDGFMWSKIFINGFSLLPVRYTGVKSRIHTLQVTRSAYGLFHQDCETMSEYLIPEFIKLTTKKDRFMFEYAKYNAKYLNTGVVKKIVHTASIKQLSVAERIVSGIYFIYGKIRNLIKKIYYRYFRNIKLKE